MNKAEGKTPPGGRTVAVLVKEEQALRFVRGFFRGRDSFRPEYFDTPQAFRQRTEEVPPAAIICESTFLKALPSAGDIPTVAVITGKNIRRSIEEAVRQRVGAYISSPFVPGDLEYKLDSLIHGKATVERMGDEKKELEAIVDLTQLILATLDPKELLYRVVLKIAEIIPVTRCSVIRVDPSRKAAYVVASYEDRKISGIKLDLKLYPEIAEALASKRPVIIKDVVRNPLMRKVRDIIAPLGIRSILVVPIFFADKIIGTLFLRTSRVERTFTDREVRLLTSLASASASVLYNAFLFEQVENEKARLEKLAITDFLTGIYNVRYFFHRITEEFSRCQRYDVPLGCLMIDIDRFKQINDVYGHKTGDRVLKEMAQELRKTTRRSDMLARYGGEEFIILLPQTDLRGAITEAERIRQHIGGLKFRSLHNGKRLTVSIGVAVYPQPGVKNSDDLISMADKALFDAKKGGRNRVTAHREKS